MLLEELNLWIYEIFNTEAGVFYKDLGKQTSMTQISILVNKNVTGGLQKPNFIFLLRAIVQYSIVQCSWQLYKRNSANNEN